MDFTLNDEQRMLQDTVQRYLRDSYDFDTRRARLYENGGRDAKLWNDLAETLGILGAPLPEEAGGMGGGAVETMVVMDALGEALVYEPFLETVVMAGGILKRIESERGAALLEKIAAGQALVSLAVGEPTARYALNDIRTSAKQQGNGWVIDGDKAVVVGAPHADMLIVAARTAGDVHDRDGIALFLVDPKADGVTLHNYRLVDERPAGDIELRGVAVDGDALLGGEGDALPLIEKIYDEATAALCAEATGVMRRMLNDTIEYTKQRKQFGQPLASFQALQHRMVDMYMAVEQSTSASYLATLKIDMDATTRAKAVSAAKVAVGKAARFVGQNAVQLHGGMGMTEELAVGHYFKRTTVIEQQFGTVDHHIARYASLTREAA